MNYDYALKYLENLVKFGIKTGLNHTKILSNRLGSPHLKFNSILIGGTNGKGSTASYIESILRISGYKTGLFTSPHLVDIRERIKLNGKNVKKSIFAEAIEKVKVCASELLKVGEIDELPTFFEVLTLASFLIFWEEKVDIAVIEVGMGGKNDCTNIVEPTISVVTNVSLDHQQYLGKTIEKIALEKSGIFRRDRVAILGKSCKKVFEILRDEAYKKGAKFFSYRDYKVKMKGENYLLKYQDEEIEFPKPPLLGKHQIDNASLSVFASLKLSEYGYNLKNSIFEGIRKCKWEGRLEKVCDSPETYLDGAHNEAGIRSLKEFALSINKKRVCVFACMKDKNIKKMINILNPLFEEIVFTTISMERAAKKENFEKILKRDFIFVESPIDAVKKAKQIAKKSGAVFVCGSLYLVGFIKSKMSNKKATLLSGL